MSIAKAPIPLPMNELANIKETGLWELIALILKRRTRFRVQGRSMLPVLEPNDLVLVAPRARIAIGDLIVLRHPFKLDVILIKYVAFINEQGAVYVLGTNLRESTDSRTIGWILPKLIFGRVQSRIRQ